MMNEEILAELQKQSRLSEEALFLSKKAVSRVKGNSVIALVIFASAIGLILFNGFKSHAHRPVETQAEAFEDYDVTTQLELGNIDSALVIAKCLHKASPKYDESAWTLGYVYHVSGQEDSALKYVSIADSIYPSEKSKNLLAGILKRTR